MFFKTIYFELLMYKFIVSSAFADDLISTLRKIVSGGEVFGSRPSLSIDICSERQVQLILEVNKLEQIEFMCY